MHNKSIYVGIDDFALKKGKDYIGVVVDQMTHMPIALVPSNQEYDGHDDTGNREMIRQTKQKLKYEYPDRDTASSLILQDIFNMGDVRHREKLKIYRESLNLKMQGMTIEQTAAHLGKKSRYIYKLIHNRRIGAYLNEQQKTALKYVSELAIIISAGWPPVKKYLHNKKWE